MKSKTSSTNAGHVSVSGNGTGDFFCPSVVIGDNDLQQDIGCEVVHTFPIVVLTVHDKGTVYTYQISTEQVDIFLTNKQKKALIKKIKMAKMVERL